MDIPGSNFAYGAFTHQLVSWFGGRAGHLSLIALALLGILCGEGGAQAQAAQTVEASGRWRAYNYQGGYYVYAGWAPYSSLVSKPPLEQLCPISTSGRWEGLWQTVTATEVRCYYPSLGHPYGGYDYIVLAVGCPDGGNLKWSRNASGVMEYWCEGELDPAKSRELLGNTCPSTSNPITIVNGNKYLGEVDVPGNVLGGLELSRHYNGLGGYATLMVGANWKLSIDRSLSFYGADKIYAFRGDGKQITFTLSGNQFRPSTGGGDVINQVIEAGVSSGWLYTNAAKGEVERYDTGGRLVSITNTRGMLWTLVRDAAGRVIEVNSALGNKITLTYSANYRLANLTLPDGTQIGYGYDLNGNLTSVTYQDGRSRVYGYNEVGQTSGASLPYALTSITDENGIRYITYNYDTAGRAVSEMLNGGVGSHTLAFNNDSSVTVTSALGKQTTYHFEAYLGVPKVARVEGHPSAGCAGANQSYTYDANGYLASKIDWNGITTTYTHDAQGRELSRTEAAGTPEARTVTTEWHSQWRLPVRISEPGKVTVFTYDDKGQLLSRNETAAP